MEYVVKIKDLKYKYRRSPDWVLKGISLSVRKGEILGIVGPSGAGKTTLCMCLNGIIPHVLRGTMEGEVTVLGMNTLEHTSQELTSKIGIVFQDPETQLFGLTVEEDVSFLPINLGLPPDEVKRRVKWSLSIVGLEGYEDRFPYFLSGGEKQRVAIASVLSGQPEVIILDEPTSELDPIGKDQVFQVINQMARLGRTMIIVEHDTERLAQIADRIIVINDGQIVLEGTPEEVFTEVTLLEKLGVKVPETVKLGYLFDKEKVGWAKKYGYPLSLEEAYERLIKIFAEKKVSKKQYTLEASKQSLERKQEEPIIKVRNLWHVYGEGTPTQTVALKNISLDIYEGEFIAIIGQNGSGKTTLVKHFNKLLTPSNGQVIVYGMDTREVSTAELAKRVGYCFQNPDHQIFSKTVWEEVTFGPKNLGLPEEEVKKRALEALKTVGLEGYEDEDPFSLGKGERQKIAVASVLAMKPDVLIVDEPTTGMDRKASIGMMELIKSLNDAGKTIIIITHDMDIVAQYARRVIVLHQGEILIDGPTNRVFSQPKVLEKTNIKPPQITRLAYKLKEYIRPDILTIEEAHKELVNVLG